LIPKDEELQNWLLEEADLRVATDGNGPNWDALFDNAEELNWWARNVSLVKWLAAAALICMLAAVWFQILWRVLL
jgi:hypothetical protein